MHIKVASHSGGPLVAEGIAPPPPKKKSKEASQAPRFQKGLNLNNPASPRRAAAPQDATRLMYSLLTSRHELEKTRRKCRAGEHGEVEIECSTALFNCLAACH